MDNASLNPLDTSGLANKWHIDRILNCMEVLIEMQRREQKRFEQDPDLSRANQARNLAFYMLESFVSSSTIAMRSFLDSEMTDDYLERLGKER